MNREQEEQQAQALANTRRLPYFDVRGANDVGSVVGLMNTLDISDYQVAPIKKTISRISFGISPSADFNRLGFIKQKFSNFESVFYVVSQSGFNEILSYLDGANLVAVASESPEKFTATLQKSQSRDIFRYLVQRAYLMRASDIHIEPKSNGIAIRFRIDGALNPILNLPLSIYKTLVSGIQTQAHMNWGTDKPQGGRLNQDIVNTEGKLITLNLRIESIPTLRGEEVIVRLLSIDANFLNLEAMDLQPQQKGLIESILARPHGMVLTTGPTNSGKTSMLYAIINKINKPELKVVTLEDPVEYELSSTSQIPVNSEDKETFTEKLRAVLRQDPNVIMLGEIRDMDTAKTALQAALTGHLVLSTFHANSSAAALSRLMDMIGHNALLPSALRLVLAKRLVRKLCQVCAIEYEPEPKVIKQISEALDSLDDSIYKPSESLKLKQAKGCDKCNQIGYLGRISLMELMEITPVIEALITEQAASATTRAIEELAIKGGMITLLQDGLLKVISGATTLEEIYRAVDS